MGEGSNPTTSLFQEKKKEGRRLSIMTRHAKAWKDDLGVMSRLLEDLGAVQEMRWRRVRRHDYS